MAILKQKISNEELSLLPWIDDTERLLFLWLWLCVFILVEEEKEVELLVSLESYKRHNIWDLIDISYDIEWNKTFLNVTKNENLEVLSF